MTLFLFCLSCIVPSLNNRLYAVVEYGVEHAITGRKASYECFCMKSLINIPSLWRELTNQAEDHLVLSEAHISLALAALKRNVVVSD